jgi:GH15 family glucan-1,4-alpha-glucosidase
MASKIEDYGLIGNCHTAALVSRFGDIDWLCAPYFDSDACFSALIGCNEHGRWALRPTVPVRQNGQRYRGDTLILESEFICDGGAVRVVDFMPVGERCDVVRIVEGLDGEVPIEMVIDVRFGYGSGQPLVMLAGSTAQFTAGPDTLVFRGPVDLERIGKSVSAYVQVKKGDRFGLQMTWSRSHERVPEALSPDEALMRTEAFWREWSGNCTYHGQWRDAVLRSLITLKALTFAPTGAIVASPTTSLPEDIGGVRNWDYRYCWLRDASLTLDALMIGGYIEETRAFREWLVRTVADDPEHMQIMYSLSGARRLTEYELDWLPGYEGSRPVRVGNAASAQFQLDVYGEVMACIYTGVKRGLAVAAEGWGAAKEILTFLESAWQRPDDGIWEVRGGPRHFTHSKIQAWVAIDRAVKGISEFGVSDDARAMLPHLSALRERMHADICQRGFNPRVGAFTQSYDSDLMDASVLVMPHVGFLPAQDPRVQGTVAAVERTLLRDGLVLRYATEPGIDGLPGDEGAFLACSFWLADNYAYARRTQEAREMFERLLGLRNHLGLLAEQYDFKRQRQIGNFPQGFSHLALICTAALIDAAVREAEVPQKRARVLI